MTYYKIILNNEIIGVANMHALRAYSPMNGMLLPSSEQLGLFISYGPVLYHDSTWMMPVPEKHYDYVEALIRTINKNEYNEYIQMLKDTLTSIIIPDEVEEEPIIITEVEPEAAIIQARELKIKQMSKACKNKIESGFDFGNYHYSLTAEDQLNLLAAQVAINNGATSILYHADNNEYHDYSAEELAFIIEAAEYHKETQLLYFNNLKTYINSLSNIEDILAVKYEG